MKQITYALIFCLSVLALTACGSHASADLSAAPDSVAVRTVKLSDTTSFFTAAGARCEIISDATIAVPSHFASDSLLVLLQGLFAEHVLAAPDSLSLDGALRYCVGNVLYQKDMTIDQSQESLVDGEGEDVTLQYNTNTAVTVYYNNHSLVTFCRVDMVTKNNTVTSVTHRYYTFDLTTMTYVDLGGVIRDDAQWDVTQLLRTRLFKQNKVSNDEQLNELGYFNADNLAVSDNFYFDEHSITWSYLPGQLAVDAIGEPQIVLSLDELKDYMSDKSVLKRL